MWQPSNLVSLRTIVAGTTAQQTKQYDLVRAIAWEAAGSLGRQARDFADDVTNDILMHYLQESDRFEQLGGSAFPQWLYVVARRRLISILRRQAKSAGPVPDENTTCDVQSCELAEDARDDWDRITRKLSELMAAIAWKPGSSVDLYATSLIWLRVNVARMAQDAAIGDALIWTNDSAQRRIRRDLPTIDDTWRAVRQHAADATVWNTVGFHQVLTVFFGKSSKRPVYRNAVMQWKSRACAQACRLANQGYPDGGLLGRFLN